MYWALLFLAGVSFHLFDMEFHGSVEAVVFVAEFVAEWLDEHYLVG